METLETYAKQVAALLDDHPAAQATTGPEARAALERIAAAQAELRRIKNAIAQDIKAIRAQFADQREDVPRGAIARGRGRDGFSMKDAARRDATQTNRQRLAQRQRLAPYEALIARIDGHLRDYDRQKSALEGVATQPEETE